MSWPGPQDISSVCLSVCLPLAHSHPHGHGPRRVLPCGAGECFLQTRWEKCLHPQSEFLT